MSFFFLRGQGHSFLSIASIHEGEQMISHGFGKIDDGVSFLFYSWGDMIEGPASIE